MQRQKIIGIGDGPASFNAEMNLLVKNVISVDPLYQFSAKEILARFNEVVDSIIDQVKATPNNWVWSYHKSPDDLRHHRLKVIEKFIADYEFGKQNRRYITGELPSLNYQSQEFDLALCSHFLFLYSEHFDYDFHLNSVAEMLRIAQEIRIFPLLTLMSKPSPYLDEIVKHYTSAGYSVEIAKVDYELQLGGNMMLKIARKDN